MTVDGVEQESRGGVQGRACLCVPVWVVNGHPPVAHSVHPGPKMTDESNGKRGAIEGCPGCDNVNGMRCTRSPYSGTDYEHPLPLLLPSHSCHGAHQKATAHQRDVLRCLCDKLPLGSRRHNAGIAADHQA